MVYVLRYATVVPYQILGLCAILNAAIILTFVFSIRKVYLRMHGLALPEGDEAGEIGSKSRMDFDRRRLK